MFAINIYLVAKVTSKLRIPLLSSSSFFIFWLKAIKILTIYGSLLPTQSQFYLLP